MKPQELKKIIRYWQETAAHDYSTMLVLYKNKRYSDSLFFGHIILEKMLKAHVVKTTKQQAPYIHDLIRLQEHTDLEFSPEIVSFLNKVNDFNIRARYPEHKLKFYKQCTKEYTQPYFDQIVILYKKLCQKLL